MSYIEDKQKISYSIITFALVVFCSLILWNANWVFDIFWADDYQFVSTTAIGRPSHAWTGNGRFWPLGLCDYCLLLLIPYGTTVTAHLIYNCITMIISSLLFFEFLKKLVGKNSYIPLFCMLILFSISSFVQIHMVCIYPEREMFLMLSIFIFFYWKATNEGDNLRNYVIAFIAAAYTTYLKEPVFGMWIIFAVINLIFGKLSLRNRKFNYALFVNSAIWIAIYTYRTIFRDRSLIDGKGGYAGFSSGISVIFSNFYTFFNQEPLLYVLLIIAIIRVCVILRNKNEYNLCDALLFSGMGYAFAYVILNTQANHYCFPTVLMGEGILAIILVKTKGYVKSCLYTASIITSVLTVQTSLFWIDRIMVHRDTDPKMFGQLIAEQKSGKQILWVTEPGKEIITEQNSRESDQMKFRRYQIFFDYYGGCHKKQQHFPFEKVSDYSKINKNTIVICSNETLASKYGEEITKRLKDVSLTLVHSNDDLETKIFQNK